MRHFASPTFWKLYEKLPSVVQELADKNFELLKADPITLSAPRLRAAQKLAR